MVVSVLQASRAVQTPAPVIGYTPNQPHLGLPVRDLGAG
jgi:hypothetical protein